MESDPEMDAVDLDFTGNWVIPIDEATTDTKSEIVIPAEVDAAFLTFPGSTAPPPEGFVPKLGQSFDAI